MQNFLFANLPFERGKILFSKGFFVYTDIRKLQDKAKTSYTLSTRRLRFGYEQQFSRSTPRACFGVVGEEGEGRQKSCPAPSQDFRLPGKNEDNEKIIKYLTEKREIEKKLVEEWIDRGDIYEDFCRRRKIFAIGCKEK